jgi:polyhydroxyalkanoate synthase
MDEKPKIPVDIILRQLAEEAGHAHERAQKASDILLGSLETDIATTPYEVVYEEDRVS